MKEITVYAQEWEKNASIDPWFAILTDMSKKGCKWDEREFFNTGEKEIRTLFEYISKHTEITLENREICLDFGCGLGRLSRALKGVFKHVVGIDISKNMTDKAKKLNPDIEFICNKTTKLAFLESATFDFVYSNIVLQHMNAHLQKGYIAEFGRILKKDGLAIFQLPSRENLRSATDLMKFTIKKVLPQKLRRKILEVLKIRSDGINIEMNALPESEVVKVAKAQGLILKHLVYTNSTEPNFNGNFQFFDKKHALERAHMMSPIYFFQKESL